MKKILLIIIAVATISVSATAQVSSIPLFVYVPEQAEEIPAASLDYLTNKLCNAVSTNGLAAQYETMTQFLLVPKINVASKHLLANTQQQVVLVLDLSLQVVDNNSGTVFSGTSISLKGVGTNETKAYNSAIGTLNRSNNKIQSFASKACEKIIAYYDAQAENIIKRAKAQAQMGNFDEAFFLLYMIPPQCKKYDDAISASLSVWEKYKDLFCNKNLAKAKSAWVAGQDYDSAEKAAQYLSRILPDAACYGDAQELYKDIKGKVGDLWKFQMKMYNDVNELRQAKIKAIQEIGVAYGKGQQPKIAIISKLHNNPKN